MKYSQDSELDSEMVFGIIGPIGCNKKLVVDNMLLLASHYSYEVVKIGVSDIIRNNVKGIVDHSDQYERVVSLMDAGNLIREQTKDNSILAKLASLKVSEERKLARSSRTIYIIDSIKHSEEVEELKNIYGRGFYLFAVHSSEENRNIFLEKTCNIADGTNRKKLIERDKDDKVGHGQGTSEAFHLADFFLTESGNNQKVWNSLERFFDIIFGDPFRTPTFHEYAMFMAHSSSVRSSDMSRQVGAVISKGTDIVATGANECPKGGGGSYWPLFDSVKNLIYDVEGGRDFMRGHDYNAKEKSKIIDALEAGIPEAILPLLRQNIKKSGIKDITEYGRVVHAEMDAILSCARRGLQCAGCVLFCTTYPCHNCAKHVVSSGIKRVIYIEPYPKSKATEMHPDSISNPDNEDDEKLALENGKVVFVPFVGVGPRQFINLFSLGLSVGGKIRRKNEGGYQKSTWERKTARPRMKMFETSHVSNEEDLAIETEGVLKKCDHLLVMPEAEGIERES